VNNDLNIQSGTLDVSNANHAIAVNGDWSNSATFTPRAGTVNRQLPIDPIERAAVEKVPGADLAENPGIVGERPEEPDRLDARRHHRRQVIGDFGIIGGLDGSDAFHCSAPCAMDNVAMYRYVFNSARGLRR
jgi:hypothetical protein